MPFRREYPTQLPLEAAREPVTYTDELIEAGFTADEIESLTWLRTWYQTGGSDRAAIIRHLEFIRLLVRSGRLEP